MSLYAELPRATARWLRRLFAAAGEPFPFVVRDVQFLARSLRVPEVQMRAAWAEVVSAYPEVSRAAREAICQAIFVRVPAAVPHTGSRAGHGSLDEERSCGA